MIISTKNVRASGDQILPMRINWDDGYRDSYVFKTDVITSHTGREQRRAVRNRPRREIELSATFDREIKWLLDNHMAKFQHARTLVPDISKPLVTVSDLGIGNQSCSYIGDAFWLSAGRRVLLVNRDLIETRTVSGFTTTTILFTEDDGLFEFPAGTRIFPASAGRLDLEFDANRLVSSVAASKVSFQVEPGGESYDQGTPYELLGEREFFTQRHNYADSLGVTYAQARDDVDMGFGRIQHYLPQAFSRRNIRIQLLASSSAEIGEIVSFFHRMKGRVGEFFMPTWEQDVVFSSMPGNGRFIVVDGQSFGHSFKDSTVFRRLMVIMKDGTRIQLEVDFIEILTDTNSTVIWLKEDLPPLLFNDTTVDRICWVLLCRFASDRIDVDYQANSVANIAPTITTLENFDL
ncbi:hypothetical protein Q669_29450 [Labrenzia sp. C1B10]|uniref:hypothetical protein n=1 Tax=unclassified Labrenzia TaxID=2648686 RepID=UPI0003B8CAE7|nr:MULTISPECIES: hypothetical protein [unclassified Labrenzia]ERP95697.1 hypothetical protein Q669_29450 [Labrenzia sp. C1B10]ERS05763.1 hypothetical protein Q675_29015 [Labrenzia sp. C1B70]